MDPYLTPGWAAPGWAGAVPGHALLSCRRGGKLGEAGVRASTEFKQALWDLQLIILGAVEAFSDFVHYPPPGSDPGSGMPGQSLAGFPRTLALRGDPNPKPAGCGWVVPVSQRSRACRQPGPGEVDRGERDLHAEARWHALPGRQGGSESLPARPSGCTSSTTLGLRSPGWPPGDRTALALFGPPAVPWRGRHGGGRAARLNRSGREPGWRRRAAPS